jgi:glycosyltransferase involved in cell wall biosynthesis
MKTNARRKTPLMGIVKNMEGRQDIICLTLSRWDAPISSPSFSLSIEFAKKNRVFYIDHPYSWKDYFKQRRTKEVRSRKNALLKGKNIYSNPPSLPSNVTVVTPRLTLPINFLPPGKMYQQLSAFNDNIINNTIRGIIKDFNVKDFIYINFFDPYFVRKFPADIKPYRTVYQCMDDISQVSYSARHGLRLEEEIVRNFDYTLCTSRELQRLKSPFSSNVFLFHNAVDTTIFKKALYEKLPKPPELQKFEGKKIIGFTGSIEYRSDFILLKKIAIAHPDKILFFVGPIGTDEHIREELDQMPNVVFAGPRKLTELPPYLQYFDCVIIPYRKTVLTKSIYPLKINEYLAAGKPVIATHFSEDIYSFKDVAYIVDTDEEFIRAIDKAIEEDSPALREKRLQVAEQNTWAVRVKQFWDIVMNDPAAKKPALLSVTA